MMEYGREFLLHNQDGKAGRLNIRELTARCGMALGTFYRYFDSKDDLVRQIMMEDWLKVKENIDYFYIKCRAAESFIWIWESYVIKRAMKKPILSNRFFYEHA